MTEEKYKYMNDEDVEELFSPKCEFHVSSGFRERVVKEARSDARRNGLRIPSRVASAVAAAAAAVVLIVMALHGGKETDTPATHRQTAAATTYAPDKSAAKKSIPPTSDRILIAKTDGNAAGLEDLQDNHESNVRKNKVRNQTREVNKPAIAEKNTEKPMTQYGVAEGPMIDISEHFQCQAPDPALVREMNEELRRSAETAYIASVRQDIEETEAYISDFRENIKYLSENRPKQQ